MKIAPSDVRPTLCRHMLLDGLDLVLDLKRSQGSRLFDATRQEYFIDFFSFFATHPIGCNHPRLLTDSARDRLATAATTKVSNSDVYSQPMAEFVDTFARLARPQSMRHLFFIEGGTLAVENGLKAAFDWKVRRNFKKGWSEERGSQILHFRQAFHGRSGYCLSMTNSFDRRKTDYFPKFKWPRVSNPKLVFPLTSDRLQQVEAAEAASIAEIKTAFLENPDDIAAIIIEPIQGEGGDNHFRKEFLQSLRNLADENAALLIFDEVQTGMGLTGKFWAAEHFTMPDIIVFGKKTQVCGMMAGPRIDEEPENVFRVPSRLNSTWGGNLVDMVRCALYLEVMRDENLVDLAAETGRYLLERLGALQEEFPGTISNVRGRGLCCAMDLPGTEARSEFVRRCFAGRLILLPCGERSVRFRTALNIDRATLDAGLGVIRKVLERLPRQ